MFETLNKHSGNTYTAPVVIVGAGAAGLTLAQALAPHTSSILLLEGGTLAASEIHQGLNEGTASGHPYLPLQATRLRYFGGTTNHWGGQSAPLENIDFENRPWVPHSGWPIDLQALAPYFQQAQEICGLGSSPMRWQSWREHMNFPLSDGFQPVPFHFSNPIMRFSQRFHEAIQSSDKIRCLLDANVTELYEDDQGNIEQLMIRSSTGDQAVVTGGTVILAAGAISNIRLLLNSTRKNARGLGNKSDNVGRFFMEHPALDTGVAQLSGAGLTPFLEQAYQRINDQSLRFDFRLNDAQQAQRGMLNHSIFLYERNPRGRSEKLWAEANSWWQALYGAVMGESERSKSMTLRIRLEQSPQPDNRITLTNERDALGVPKVNLHLDFSPLESHSLQQIHNALGAEFHARKLGNIDFEIDPQQTQWRDQVFWQFHHMGGTRMHDDPAQGVVDRNLRVHEVSNLYIASSSVFPTGGHSNPTINLIALVLRLADHLIQSRTLH